MTTEAMYKLVWAPYDTQTKQTYHERLSTEAGAVFVAHSLQRRELFAVGGHRTDTCGVEGSATERPPTTGVLGDASSNSSSTHDTTACTGFPDTAAPSHTAYPLLLGREASSSTRSSYPATA